MKKFPSIESFRHIKNYTNQIIKYQATVKIHGTNGGVWYKDGELIAQSRNQILTENNTNSGFYNFVMDRKDDFITFLSQFGDDVVLYGEFCGKGIQSGTAISQVDKKFLFFRLLVNDEVVDISGLESKILDVFNIFTFGSWNFEVDFENPDLSKIEDLCNEIENRCPVGAYFGIEGVGEGIVLTSIPYVKEYTFKFKGDKHKVAKIPNTAIQLTLDEIGQLDVFLTEARFKQGLENIELDIKNIGNFIKSIIEDIYKEESNTLENLDKKLVNKHISSKAKNWFMDKL